LRVPETKEEPKLRQNDEVQVALEELKEELKHFQRFTNNSSTTLTRAAQKLINAIDDFNILQNGDYCISQYTKEFTDR